MPEDAGSQHTIRLWQRTWVTLFSTCQIMAMTLVTSTARFCKIAPAQSTRVSVAVAVLVVGVRKMRVAVLQRRMLVAVRMPRRCELALKLRMVMQVVRVVRMGMFMVQRCV